MLVALPPLLVPRYTACLRRGGVPASASCTPAQSYIKTSTGYVSVGKTDNQT